MKKELQIKQNQLSEIEQNIESVFKFQFSAEDKSNTSQLVAEKLEKLVDQKKGVKNFIKDLKSKLNISVFYMTLWWGRIRSSCYV